MLIKNLDYLTRRLSQI